jgi:hypothetical protein
MHRIQNHPFILLKITDVCSLVAIDRYQINAIERGMITFI